MDTLLLKIGLFLALWKSIYCQTSAPSTGGVRIPPSFLQTPSSITYKSSSTVTLTCIATGTPTPTYTWNRGGKSWDYQSDSNVQNPSDGTLTIQNTDETYSLSYQCFAKNAYGTAMSNITYLQMAVLGTYTSNNVGSKTVTVGDSIQFKCAPLPSVPSPTYSWATAPSTASTTNTPVTLSDRVMVDFEGSLNFANVISTDATNGSSVYKCLVYNSVLDQAAGGSYTSLSVTSGTPASIKPTNGPMTPSPLSVTAGQPATFFCFFNGFPTPTITWTTSLPSSRYNITQYSTTFTITQVQADDDPTISCTGTNSGGSATNPFSLTVNVPPFFASQADKPHNINATDGDNVEIYCKSSGGSSSSQTTFWYQNAIGLSASNLPSNMALSPDSSTLTVSNVCKVCADGSSDLTVIQCNVTNSVGYAYAQGYLNILLPTVITTSPTSQTLQSNTIMTFQCSATSDPSTPVSYSWFHDGQLIEYNTDYIYTSGGDLKLNTGTAPNGGKDYIGTLTCEASNDYSALNVSAQLQAAPAVVTSAADYWYIFLLLALLILLLILLLLWCYCRDYEADSYPVDKQETKNGNDPVKELQDNDFHDYQRQNILPAERPPEMTNALNYAPFNFDDMDSMGGYSDMAGGGFNEEGSFVGQYVPQQQVATNPPMLGAAPPDMIDGNTPIFTVDGAMNRSRDLASEHTYTSGRDVPENYANIDNIGYIAPGAPFSDFVNPLAPPPPPRSLGVSGSRDFVDVGVVNYESSQGRDTPQSHNMSQPLTTERPVPPARSRRSISKSPVGAYQTNLSVTGGQGYDPHSDEDNSHNRAFVVEGERGTVVFTGNQNRGFENDGYHTGDDYQQSYDGDYHNVNQFSNDNLNNMAYMADIGDESAV